MTQGYCRLVALARENRIQRSPVKRRLMWIAGGVNLLAANQRPLGPLLLSCRNRPVARPAIRPAEGASRERHQAAGAVCAPGHRADVVRALGGRGPVRAGFAGRRAVRDHPAAAERDGHPAYGALPRQLDPGHPHPLLPHARPQRSLGAGNRPREHRDGAGRQPPDARRRHRQARGRPRRVPRARLDLEGTDARPHHRPDAPARVLARLVARGVHDGRGAQPRRHPRLRRSAPQGPHLPRPLPRELVSALPDGDQRRRGRVQGARRLHVAHPVPAGRRRRVRDRGDDPPGDHVRRCRGRGESGRPRAQAPHRSPGASAADRPRDPHRGRPPRRSREGHRLRQDHARARPQRLSRRQASRSAADHLHGRARRHERAGRGPGRARPRRGPRAHGRRAGGRGSAGQDREARPPGGPSRPLRHRDRAVPEQAVVPADGGPGGAGGEGRRGRCGHAVPRALDRRLPQLDAQHPRLVHQPPALVGAPDPGLVLPAVRRGDGGHRGADEMRQVRQRRAGPGRRRAGHLVQQLAVDLLAARLARQRRRREALPSHERAGDRRRSRKCCSTASCATTRAAR